MGNCCQLVFPILDIPELVLLHLATQPDILLHHELVDSALSGRMCW